MTPGTEAATAEHAGDADPSAERRRVELLIDEMVAQSFPASDPPAWGAIAALLELAKEHDAARAGRSAEPPAGGQAALAPAGGAWDG
jgi:hypothetical protein